MNEQQTNAKKKDKQQSNASNPWLIDKQQETITHSEKQKNKKRQTNKQAKPEQTTQMKKQTNKWMNEQVWTNPWQNPKKKVASPRVELGFSPC